MRCQKYIFPFSPMAVILESDQTCRTHKEDNQRPFCPSLVKIGLVVLKKEISKVWKFMDIWRTPSDGKKSHDPLDQVKLIHILQYKKVKKKQIKQKTKVKNKSSVYKCFYKYFSFSITMTTTNCVNPLLTWTS